MCNLGLGPGHVPTLDGSAAEGDCSLERPRKLQLNVNDTRTSNETAIEGYICNPFESFRCTANNMVCEKRRICSIMIHPLFLFDD